MKTYVTLVCSPLPSVDLYYSSDLILLQIDFITANNSSYSHNTKYYIKTGKIEITYVGLICEKEFLELEDSDEIFKSFIRNNKDKISMGLGIFSEKQQGLVRKFLDELENNPPGLSGFLET